MSNSKMLTKTTCSIFKIKKILCLVLIGLIVVAGQAQRNARLVLTNPTDLQRSDELIVVQREQLEKKVGTLSTSQYVDIRDRDNKPVLVQFDDRNGDSIWDEIVFLQSFEPHEKVVLNILLTSTHPVIEATARAHVRHSRKNADDTFGPLLERDSIPAGQQPTDFSKKTLPPFLTEGPAWENDKIGFRLYLDVRNSKDIWGKTTPQMVLDEVGKNPAKNYHQLAEWGMDILKVGNSLGAGGLALQIRLPNGKDSLVRLGGVNMGKVIYERIVDGPVRAVFRLQYPRWKILEGLPPVIITEEISIWGGQYFYESKVHVEGAPANSKLVTGIVNLESKQSNKLDTAGQVILYTYDAQSENNDKLGMAIMMDKKSFSAIGTTPNVNTDIQNTYTVSALIDQKSPINFRFYACWERADKQFQSEPGFRNFLVGQVNSIKHPITFLLQ